MKQKPFIFYSLTGVFSVFFNGFGGFPKSKSLLKTPINQNIDEKYKVKETEVNLDLERETGHNNRYTSSNKKHDFLDFSGGLLGI